MPQGLPADSTPSPGPEFRKGLLTPVCPPEAVQNSAEGGQEILRYIRGSRFSETQPRGFQGKAGGGGRAGGSPLQAVPSGLGASACCLLREGWREELLPVRGVGSSGQRGRQGRMRQAQFCWWGAWAPWV